MRNNNGKDMYCIVGRNTAYMLLFFMVAMTACKKLVPKERNTIGGDSGFTLDTYEPILGRTTYFTDNFYQGSTTYPADFKIINVRRRTGEPAPELTDAFPVKVWKAAYTGEEKSIAEIEAKRREEYHSILEMSPHTGDITFWGAGKSDFIFAQPDSGYLFDVELSNSGGRRFFRNLKLMPMKEIPTLPTNLNAMTGQPVGENFGLSFIENVIGTKNSGRNLGFSDVDVYIRKANPSTRNALTFRFLDTLYQPMNPAIFNTTDWANLVHGFNMKMTDTYVQYDVAYPIPLVSVPTRYTTSDGRTARAAFTWSRIGFGGARINASFGLNFAIYDPGDWEIVFAFKNDVPKTTDDL